MDRAARLHARIEFDLAECGLILRHILLQNRQQRLCLLRAYVDTLEICYFDLVFRLLLQSPKYQEKIPHVNPDLNTVGVLLTVIRRVDQLDIRLYG